MNEALTFLENNRRLRAMTESSSILKESKDDFDLEACFNGFVSIYLAHDEENKKKLVLTLATFLSNCLDEIYEQT